MKRFVLTAALVGISLALVEIPTAEAVTCSSVCNQIRRACRRSGKAVRQVERANCSEERDSCRLDCEANEATCPVDCQTASDACVLGCGGEPTCEAGCAAGLAQCLDDCDNCAVNCQATRKICNDDADIARGEFNLTCDVARESCRGDDGCIDPIDPDCVRSCRSDRKSCDRRAKVAQKSCKSACPKGSGRRACFRDCRRDMNAARVLCADDEALCLGKCAGLYLPPSP